MSEIFSYSPIIVHCANCIPTMCTLVCDAAVLLAALCRTMCVVFFLYDACMTDMTYGLVLYGLFFGGSWMLENWSSSESTMEIALIFFYRYN